MEELIMQDEQHYSDEVLDISTQSLEQSRADDEWRDRWDHWVEESSTTPKRKREEEKEEEEKVEVQDAVITLNGESIAAEVSVIGGDSKKAKVELPPQLPSNDELFVMRKDDFTLFLERRVPPNNPTAEKYMMEFKLLPPKAFAEELLNKLTYLNMFGGMDLVFERLCAKCAMKAEDFVDRSIERPDLDTVEKRKAQLTNEILDFHTQLKDLLKLAKQLSPKFWE